MNLNTVVIVTCIVPCMLLTNLSGCNLVPAGGNSRCPLCTQQIGLVRYTHVIKMSDAMCGNKMIHVKEPFVFLSHACRMLP